MFKFKSRKKLTDGPFMIPLLTFSSLLLIFALSLLTSLVVMRLDNPLSAIGASALCALVLSGALSGIICERLTRDVKKAMIALGITCGIILVFSLVFGNIAGGVMNGLCFFGTGALTALFSKAFASKKRRRR